MHSPRFATVQDLFKAFPTAQEDVGVEPSGVSSLRFLRSQVRKRNWDSAVSYCAYLLERRYAVLWGCQSLRQMPSQSCRWDLMALDAAEAWARDPDEENRYTALDIGNDGDKGSPSVWMALAAGWSVGNVVRPEQGHVQAAPHSTALAVRAGLLMARCRAAPVHTSKIFGACLENGMQMAAAYEKRSEHLD
jgi:hypothetical protein